MYMYIDIHHESATYLLGSQNCPGPTSNWPRSECRDRIVTPPP